MGASGTSLQYQWYRGSKGDTSSPVSGGIASSVSVAPSTTTSYWVRVSNSCGSVNSNTATVTVTSACAAPSITSQPLNKTVQQGQFATLSVGATGSSLQYQWYQGSKRGYVASGRRGDVRFHRCVSFDDDELLGAGVEQLWLGQQQCGDGDGDLGLYRTVDHVAAAEPDGPAGSVRVAVGRRDRFESAVPVVPGNPRRYVASAERGDLGLGRCRSVDDDELLGAGVQQLRVSQQQHGDGDGDLFLYRTIDHFAAEGGDGEPRSVRDAHRRCIRERSSVPVVSGQPRRYVASAEWRDGVIDRRGAVDDDDLLGSGVQQLRLRDEQQRHGDGHLGVRTSIDHEPALGQGHCAG